jgi:hypothetical protein
MLFDSSIQLFKKHEQYNLNELLRELLMQYNRLECPTQELEKVSMRLFKYLSVNFWFVEDHPEFQAAVMSKLRNFQLEGWAPATVFLDDFTKRLTH